MWVLMATAAAIRPECFNRHGGKVGIVCWVHMSLMLGSILLIQIIILNVGNLSITCSELVGLLAGWPVVG